MSSQVVGISLLNCFQAVHVLLNNPVISKPILTRLAAWCCCLFIQGFANKAKFLREHRRLAVCMSACLHKCLCAWLVVSWERTCVIWFHELLHFWMQLKTLMWIFSLWIHQMSIFCGTVSLHCAIFMHWITCIYLFIILLPSGQNSWTLKLSSFTNSSIHPFLHRLSGTGLLWQPGDQSHPGVLFLSNMFSSSWEIPNAPRPPGTWSPPVCPRCPPRCLHHCSQRKTLWSILTSCTTQLGSEWRPIRKLS